MAIARELGVSDPAVHNRAKAQHWPKRGKKAAAPKGEKLSGATRCNHCQVMTEHDPCDKCGSKLKRNW